MDNDTPDPATRIIDIALRGSWPHPERHGDPDKPRTVFTETQLHWLEFWRYVRYTRPEQFIGTKIPQINYRCPVCRHLP